MDKKKIALIIGIIVIILIVIIVVVKMTNNNQTIETRPISTNSDSNKPAGTNNENAVYDEEGNLVGYTKPAEVYPKNEIAGTVESNGLTYSNIYIEEREKGQCYIMCTVKNNTEETVKDQLILIKLYNDKVTEEPLIGTLGGELKFIAPDSEAKVEIPAAADLMSVTRMEIEFYNE